MGDETAERVEDLAMMLRIAVEADKAAARHAVTTSGTAFQALAMYDDTTLRSTLYGTHKALGSKPGSPAPDEWWKAVLLKRSAQDAGVSMDLSSPARLAAWTLVEHRSAAAERVGLPFDGQVSVVFSEPRSPATPLESADRSGTYRVPGMSRVD